MDSFSKALLISAIGIGLVFLGILILWGMMEIAVRFGNLRKSKPSPDQAQKPKRDVFEAKRKAAAAAVITAMALHDTAFTASSHKNREVISAWQASHRSQQMRSAFLTHRRDRKG